ncbi:hypothetical protein ACFUIY_13405 [Streptomyces griseorubiginosus]|uniref:hypothetical protein n=1 Tax=Streptomyces griseorubiginosus TaxID=67304 RepID=UPI003630417E
MKLASASSVASVPFCSDSRSIRAATGGTAVSPVSAGAAPPVSAARRTAHSPESVPPTASRPPSGAVTREVFACRSRVTGSPPVRGTPISRSPDLSTKSRGLAGTERATTSQFPATPTDGTPSVPGSFNAVAGAERSARSSTWADQRPDHQTSRSALSATPVGTTFRLTSPVTFAVTRSTSIRWCIPFVCA